MPWRGELFEILDKKIVGITIFFQILQRVGERFLRDVLFPLNPRGKLLGRAASRIEEAHQRGRVGRSGTEKLEHDAFLLLLGHGITSFRREYRKQNIRFQDRRQCE